MYSSEKFVTANLLIMAATETNAQRPTVSVIIPARNEEACLADCLQSLVAQSGVAFEIIVVDDRSTDRTREIAQSFPEEKVRVIEAPPLPAGWTGKNNAVTTGARQAPGEWLLFTDADTVHLPGSLAGAMAEAQENHADLLSYSPEQIAVTFWEMATLPVVFAELARQYPPSVVSDPTSPIAAANGQFILIRRDAYAAGRRHAAIAADILEDVALARAVKRSGRKIRFRFAPDAVRTRMYRNYRELRDGWTKNLALLFPQPGRLAAEDSGLLGNPVGRLVHGVCESWLVVGRDICRHVSLSRNSNQASQLHPRRRPSSCRVWHADVRVFVTAFEEGPRHRQCHVEGPHIFGQSSLG